MTNTFNLLPWRERRALRWQRQRYGWAGLAVLLALGTGFWADYALMQRLTEQHSRNTEWQSRLAHYSHEIQEIQQMVREKTQFAENWQKLQAIQQTQIQQQTALVQLARDLPSNLRLTQLHYERMSWSLEGICDDVSALLAWLPRLNNIPELGDAHLESVREQSAHSSASEMKKEHHFRVIVSSLERVP